jgi:glycosyltransferase involved in cell wall biosynthesis
MWQINSIYPQWSVRGTSAKIVVSPRGALSPWAMTHGSRLKRVMWPLLQRPSLRAAACFHATADAELHQIRELGFTQPVAVIPNGVDIPGSEPRKPDDFRTLLFLGRIHPKKGVDTLLHAWHAVMGRFPDWRLKIVGSDAVYGDASGYLTAMKTLSARLGLERVSFEGPHYGAAKWDAYGAAELFVLPSHSENFGMTVAESLAAGTPVVVTKGAPWAEIETHGCGWWIDGGAASLAAALDVALREPREALSARGAAGRAWVARTYSWTTVAANMRLVYQWLMGGADAPDCVKH